MGTFHDAQDALSSITCRALGDKVRAPGLT
jgi:hypothetical protein